MKFLQPHLNQAHGDCLKFLIFLFQNGDYFKLYTTKIVLFFRCMFEWMCIDFFVCDFFTCMVNHGQLVVKCLFPPCIYGEVCHLSETIMLRRKLACNSRDTGISISQIIIAGILEMYPLTWLYTWIQDNHNFVSQALEESPLANEPSAQFSKILSLLAKVLQKVPWDWYNI